MILSSALFAAAAVRAQEKQTLGGAVQSVTVHWPQFRGPQACGVAEGVAPTKWDAVQGENIRWKTPIPGLGHSSPVIWGDRVFLTTAISGQSDPLLKVGLYGNIEPVMDDTEHRWLVICLDKNTGSILWEREAHRGVPKVKRHQKATHANCTAATDGRHLVAFFGSEGLYTYTIDGELKWKKDFGVLDAGYYVVPPAQWEFGSSPVIHNDRVIVQCDVQKDSFIAALDLSDGREIWRKPRDEVPTWSTPTVFQRDGAAQIVVNGFRHIGGYNADDGKEIWRMRGGGDIPVPTPVVVEDLIFITNAHGEGAPFLAIKTSARGDLSSSPDAANEHIAWSYDRVGNYMQTPIVYGDYVYGCRDNGVMSCYEFRTGKKLYRERLGDGQTGFTASPVAAEGKLYYSSEDGDVYVVKAGPSHEVLSINPMGEPLMATPALSEGRLFVRGKNHIFCIER